MRPLRWTEMMFVIAGCHLRVDSYSPVKKLLYQIYTLVGLTLVNIAILAQILDFIFNVESQDEFVENFAVLMSAVLVIVKYIVLSTHRGNMLNLIEELNRNFFQPANKEEMEIRATFDSIVELRTKVYTISLAALVTGMFILTVVVDYEGRELVGRLWLPYDYSSILLYLLTSAGEYVASVFGVSVSLACECLFAGLMLHVCCQFEILEHRFKSLSGKDICAVNRCISHHYHIYKYAEMINNEFKEIVSCQFFTSIFILCLNLYQMLIAENVSDSMSAVMYTICMFSQIFYYCFHGDVVKSKSTNFPDEIFGSDWPSWNDNSKKLLLMVIRRSRTPIEFTSMHIVTLNLESFMSLIKTSYSAFNLMTSG